MSQLIIHGTVSVEGGEFGVAGVTVLATIAPDLPDNSEHLYERSHARERLLLGRAITTNDGTFVITTDESDAKIARWVCAMQSCTDFQFRLSCLDIDDTVLQETDPWSWIMTHFSMN